MLFNMFGLNQHLSKKGIIYAINSLWIALFGYLGMQYSTERPDVASTKDVLIVPSGLKNIPFPLTWTGFFVLFERKNHVGEVGL